MNYWVEKIEEKLTEEETFFLKKIYEPKVVLIPPNDACRNMCVTPDGEIRIYGSIDKAHFNDVGTPVYAASRDGGITWKNHLVPKGSLGAAGYSPETGRYISAYPNYARPEWKEELKKRQPKNCSIRESFIQPPSLQRVSVFPGHMH